MKKVGISVMAIVLVWVLTINSMGSTSILKDLKESDWFYENVMILVNKGIIEGDTNGNFLPNQSMTVDQFIKTMVIALGYPLEKGKDYWAQPFIDKAIDLGVVKNGDFASYKNSITRGEMAMLTVRVVEMLEGAKTYTYIGNEEYKLVNSISDYSSIKSEQKAYVLKAYELGTITGYPGGSFKAGSSLKRSEACTVIRRVIDEKERVPFIYLGIEIMDNLDGHDPDAVDFSIMINVLSPLEPQYKQAESYLNNIVGEKLTKDIMKIVKTKTSFEQVIFPTYFDWKQNKKLQVSSPGGYTDITIRAW